MAEVPVLVIPCFDVTAAEARYRQLIPDPALAQVVQQAVPGLTSPGPVVAVAASTAAIVSIALSGVLLIGRAPVES